MSYFFNYFSLNEYVEEQRNQKRLEKEKQHSIQNISEFESICFEDLINESKELQKIDEKGLKEIPTFRQLEEDIYSAFYQSRPELNKTGMYKPYQINRTIVEKIMSMEQYPKLRKYTKLNRQTSSKTAIKMAAKALELLDEELKEKIRQQHEKLMAMQGEDGDDGDDGDENQNNSQKQKAGKAGKGNSKNDEGEDEDDGEGFSLTQAEIDQINKALEKAFGQTMKEMTEQEIEKENAIKAFGNEEGGLTTTSVEQAEKIMQKIKGSHILQQVIKQAGRLRDIAKAIRVEKFIDVREEIVDVEIGNDISRLTAFELACLAGDDDSPESLLALKKFAEGEMNQYRYQGKEDKGKGPLIVEIDRSGSMQGTNETWARASLLVLQQICKEDKRDMHVIYYDSRIYKEIFLPLGVPKNVDEWMAFVAIGSDGGTEFMKPLDRAADIIAKETHMRQADVIFISDGGCYVHDEWLKKYQKRKEELGFNIVGILIGGGGDVMRQFSEKVIDIVDIRDDAEAVKAMFSV